MITKKIELVVLIAVTVLILSFLGCSGPESHPVIKKAIKDVNRHEEEIVDLKGKVEKVQSESDSLFEEVDKIKKQQKSSTDATAAISALEQRLTKAESELKAVASSMEDAKKARRKSESQKEEGETKTSKSAIEKPGKTAATKGFYYTVEAGDTISKIASKFKISPEKLIKDNNLPANAELIPKQKIYVIPSGGK